MSRRMHIAEQTVQPAAQGMLQRQCACGQHSGGQRACDNCRDQQDGLLQRRTSSPAGIVAAAQRAAPPTAGSFGHDFSRMQLHSTPYTAAIDGALGPDSPFGTRGQSSDTDASERPFGDPLPYAEAVEAIEREQFERNAPVVNVTTTIPPVTIDHTKSGAEISRISSRTHPNRTNAGLTRAQLRMRLAVATDHGPLTNNRMPVWITSVNVTPNYESITQWIASEYAVNSCEYRETLAHEDEHVRIDRELLETYAGRMRRALIYSFIPTQSNPLSVGSAEEGEQRATERVRNILQPIYTELRQALHQANNDLDDPTVYQRVYARCRNW